MPGLTASSVVEYLRGRGVLTPTEDASAQVLGGGVSNEVLLVRTTRSAFVVKQALDTLRVADEWHAKRERTLTEADALRTLHRLTPDMVPDLVDVDSEAIVLTMEAAPAGWRDWKTILLSDATDRDGAPADDADRETSDAAELSVARAVGRTVGRWHAAWGPEDLRGTRFDDPDTFEQLRVAPYHRAVMQRCPEVADLVGDVISSMAARRDCLVHGDLSPKNVLVGDGRVWIIDFEVAHRGEPRFDLAFLLCHLLLKSVHQPARATAHAAAARAFVDAYRSVPDAPGGIVDAVLSAHVGCLLLARVFGKSPAEYLTETDRRRVAALGTGMLRRAPADPLTAWERIEA